jgi:putative oxidoreductase
MIKNILNPGTYPTNINLVLVLLRVVIGAFMISHGAGKLMKFFADDPLKFADPIGIGVTASLSLAVFAEVFCSIFLIVGFTTRLATIPLLTTMLVAALIVHAHDGFGTQELPFVYSMIFLTFAATGAGKYSIDNWIYHKIHRS